jgi:prepilin-type processing-associated H-X9-DG protein
MKRYLFFLGFFCVLASCRNDGDKAMTYLENARSLYESGQYESGKQLLDSIKILFPEELEVKKQGLQLSRLIDIRIQERNYAFCDSILPLLQAEAEVMKKQFLFEKDARYDEIGNYFDKRQKLENKLQRSYIRSSVNELGEFSLASVYYGSQAIRHTRLKVLGQGEEYTETDNIPHDGGVNYSFVDMGMTTEVVTYKGGKDKGVVSFIRNNKDKVLKAEYLGGKKYSFTISEEDKQALAKTLGFSEVLSGIEKMKKEKEKAEKRIEYLKEKAN